MRSLVNQHSYVLVVVFALAIAGFAAWRLPGALPRTMVLGGALLLLAMAPLALRTGASSMQAPEQVAAVLAGGTPTLVEFYSDF